MFPTRTKPCLAVILAPAIVLLGITATAAGQGGTTNVVAKTGDPVPGGNGQFDRYQDQVTINNLGQVAYRAFLQNTSGGIGIDDLALFQTNASGAVQLLSRRGQASPIANFNVWDFSDVALDGAGRVTYQGNLKHATTGSTEVHLMRAFPDTTMQVLVARGQLLPGSTTLAFRDFLGFNVNQAGQVAFLSRISGSFSGIDTGVYYVDGAGTVREVLRPSNMIPPYDVSVTGVSDYQIDQSGRIGLWAAFNAGASGTTTRILLNDGANWSALAEEGQNVPNSPYLIEPRARQFHNNVGGVTFTSDIVDFQTDIGSGLFEVDGSGLRTIAIEGDPIPPGGGNWCPSFPYTTTNDAGTVVFTGGTSANPHQMFRSVGTGVERILNIAGGLPGGGTHDGYSRPHINNQGQIAFRSDILGGGSGFYYYDEAYGWLKAIKTGDSLLGSTVNLLSHSNEDMPGGANSEFNENGQIAFGFRLSNGNEGVAIWTPPAPVPVNNGSFLAGTLDGWTSSGADVTGDPSGTGHGSVARLRDLSGVAVLEQSITLPNEVFLLDYEFLFAGGGPGTLNVRLGGTIIDSVAHVPQSAFVQRQLPFTDPSLFGDTITLRFEYNSSFNDGTVFLDGIGAALAVPEPSAMGFLASALLLLRRRRPSTN